MRKIGNKDFQLSPQDTQFQEDNKFNIANVFWVAIALFLKKRRLNVRGTPGSVLIWLTWLKILVIVVIVFWGGNIRSILAVSQAGNFLYPAAWMQI